MSQPTIPITIGDPADIGPQIVAPALGEEEIRARCHPVVIGDPRSTARTVEFAGDMGSRWQSSGGQP